MSNISMHIIKHTRKKPIEYVFSVKGREHIQTIRGSLLKEKITLSHELEKDGITAHQKTIFLDSLQKVDNLLTHLKGLDYEL